MSLRFEEETNVYDDCGNLLGRIECQLEGDPYFPSFFPSNNAEITIYELREIADHLENL